MLPKNCSSSGLADRHDDPGALGTHTVESGSTPLSLPAVVVTPVTTSPPAVSRLTLPHPLRPAKPGGRLGTRLRRGRRAGKDAAGRDAGGGNDEASATDGEVAGGGGSGR